MSASKSYSRLGPFAVRTGSDDVRRFACGVENDDTITIPAKRVPWAFPLCWMTLPIVRDQLLAQYENCIALLIRQTLNYQRPLQIDEDYLLSIDVPAPDQTGHDISVTGMVRTLRGETVATITSALKLLSHSSGTVEKLYNEHRR